MYDVIGDITEIVLQIFDSQQIEEQKHRRKKYLECVYGSPTSWEKNILPGNTDVPYLFIYLFIFGI